MVAHLLRRIHLNYQPTPTSNSISVEWVDANIMPTLRWGYDSPLLKGSTA